MRGRVEAGRSAGGLCYGYRAVRVLEGQPRGERKSIWEAPNCPTNFPQLRRRSVSPKAIAKTLNAEGIPGPRGTAWSPRQYMDMQDAARASSTTSCTSVDQFGTVNGTSSIRTPGSDVASTTHVRVDLEEVPEFRIVDDHSGGRQSTASGCRHNEARNRSSAAAQIPVLGPDRCATCGGGFILSSRDRLVCFNARAAGTCTNVAASNGRRSKRACCVRSESGSSSVVRSTISVRDSRRR